MGTDLKTSLTYVIIAVMTVLAGLAITQYFNLLSPMMEVVMPASPKTITTPTTLTTAIITTVTSTLPSIRTVTIGPLKVSISNIVETDYINLYGYEDTKATKVCLKIIPDMKFATVVIRIENIGYREISLKEIIPRYFNNFILITDAGRSYSISDTYQLLSPKFLIPMPQEECLRNNAPFIYPRGSSYYVLKPNEYVEIPIFFIIPRSDTPTMLQIVKDDKVITTISLR
jgi:hypothetical protein